MFYVYVLQSQADYGLYIGYSANLRQYRTASGRFVVRHVVQGGLGA
jgi:predicted GIY-YIG superfamily endonuclease